MNLVHLHTHSHYSLLDGLSKIDDLISQAKEMGQTAIALTDHGNLYGAVEFFKKATKAGIKPIIGCEVYIYPHKKHKKEKREETFHLILLAKNLNGYNNLVKMTSHAFTNGFYYRPRVDLDTLKKYKDDLICLSSCLGGELASASLKDGERAEKVAASYKKIFGSDYYIELQQHLAMPEQSEANKVLIEISRKLDIPLVATQDSHYVKKDDAEIQDVLLAIQTGAKVADEKRFRMDQDDFSLCSFDEMYEKFDKIDWVIAGEAIGNTERIAEDCNVHLKLGELQLPDYPVPEGYEDPFEYLTSLAKIGMVNKFGTHIKEPLERLEYELGVVKETGFATYFLIVQDVVNWTRDNGIAVGPGRGSAAGSFLSYVLGITGLDPIKYGLLFERFLNPERISMPDIDLDFSDRRRGEVLKYVADKYGHDHVAQIITFGKMAARSAIKDSARVLDMPHADANNLSQLIPFNPNQDKDIKDAGTYLQYCIENEDEVKKAYSDPQNKKIIDIAIQLEGTVRHHGVHPCAVVITPKPLTDHLPIQHASDGETVVTQYDMNSVEDLGLLKMDFLGLTNLTVIEDTLNMVAKRKGIRINIDNIPLNDEKAYKLLQKGETTGVFQLESPGMKKNLRKLLPTDIEDIIAMISLYRPGPMDLIPDYIKRKHGRQEVSYLYPALEPVLKSTYGVMIYQEQLIESVRVLAGFSRGGADVLRKAVGKKIKSLMDEQEGKFKEGAKKTGTPKTIADEFWALVEPFARYGFNRAHAACYGMIAYQTAYLKAHFPKEFMAAFLTSEMTSIEELTVVIEECSRMGIEILPPDINESTEVFTVSGEAIRFGLTAIKNIGTKIVESIIKERENGEYQSLMDLIMRVDNRGMNRKTVEFLAKSGALDQLGDRNELLANMDLQVEFGRALKKHPKAMLPPVETIPSDPATKAEKALWEKELLGLYVTWHPLKDYRTRLYSDGCISIADIELIDGSRIKVGGVMGDVKKRVSKKGNNIATLVIQDTAAKLKVVVFPQVLARTENKWKNGNICIMVGKIDVKDETPTLLVDSVEVVAKGGLLLKKKNSKV